MSIKLSYDEAYAVTQFHVADLAHKTWLMGDVDYRAAVEDATLRLRWLIGSATVNEQDIYDLLNSYEQLTQFENGSHEDIEVNETLSIDNRPELYQRILNNIHEETFYLLTNAGITKPVKAAA